MFQNWTLAVAAYNCGERRIQAEIVKQKTSSYYFLKLPQETERYVFQDSGHKGGFGKPREIRLSPSQRGRLSTDHFRKGERQPSRSDADLVSGGGCRGYLPGTEGAQSLPGFGCDPERGPYYTGSRGQRKASSRKGWRSGNPRLSRSSWCIKSRGVRRSTRSPGSTIRQDSRFAAGTILQAVKYVSDKSSKFTGRMEIYRRRKVFMKRRFLFASSVLSGLLP